MQDPEEQITQWLRAHESGDPNALDHLIALVYPALKQIARRRLGIGGPDRTLNTTGLVNEAYLKLAAHTRAGWRDRKHFFRVAARAMRQIVIDDVRRRQAARRDERLRDTLDERIEDARNDDWLIDVNEALDRLGQVDERLARLVEFRFFAGYTEIETAELMGVSERTVRNYWTRARAWLRAELESDDVSP